MKEIAFRRGSDILRGYLHRPQQVKESAPGIVIIPGFADTAVGPHNMHRTLADALQDIGCIVLRFDYRGQGESDGNFHHFTAQSGKDDARGALDLLRVQTGVDATRLGLVGFSLGGALARELAANVLEVQALALLAPVAYPQKVFASFFTPSHLEQAEQQGWMDWLGWAVGRDFLLTLGGVDPLAAMKRTQAAVLVIHGTANVEVPPENGAAYEKLGAVPYWLDGDDHQFSSIHLQDQAIQRVCSWFSTYWQL